MNEQYKGKMVSGDSTINAEHHKNESSMDVSVDKRDVAQIYVVQIKQQVKSDLKKAKDERKVLTDKSLTLVGKIDSLINSTVEKSCKAKADKVNKIYKALKADLKALVKKASSKVDTHLAALFEDVEDIDTRIKTSVTTPNITYSWRAKKAVKDDGSGEIEVLRITIGIDGHSETKDIAVPANIAALKTEQLGIEAEITTYDSQIRDLNEKLNSTKDLQEAAEAAVAMAKLDQSEFGKKCLDNLQNLSSTGQLLLGTKED